MTPGVDVPLPLPIESALADEAERLAFAAADFIIGADRSQPGHWTLMAGRERLEHLAKLGKTAVLTWRYYTYDSRTESLEFFAGACLALRGSCDYRSWADDVEEDAQRETFMSSLSGGRPPRRRNRRGG